MKIPGLVDLQVNGFRGVDFSSAELTGEQFTKACAEILESGTTAFLATVITSSRAVYNRNLAVIADVIDSGEFEGRLLGIHLEGPFISPVDGARGAHCTEWVCRPDTDYFKELLQWGSGHVKMLTLAAEQTRSEDVTACAVEAGVAVSLGHQMAGADDLKQLARAGARGLTHLGNGIPSVLDRHNNPIWAGLAIDELTAMIITDGHHLPADMIKTFIKAKGTDRIVVVSDASPIAGLPPGRYETLGNDVVLAENGKLFNPATGYMVGSSATMLDCMNYLASLELLSVEELLDVGFHNPLALIGVDSAELQGMGTLDFDEHRGTFKKVQRS